MRAEPYTVFVEKPTRTDMRGLEHLAWLMDRAIKVPGTNITVGLDALLGLLPIGGDLLTGLIQAGLVLVAVHHHRVPRAIAARMAANVLIDTAIGAVPILGDVFDVFFKANTRNIKLLHQVEEQRSQHKEVATAPSILYLALLATALLAILSLTLIGFVAVVAWVWKHVSAS